MSVLWQQAAGRKRGEGWEMKRPPWEPSKVRWFKIQLGAFIWGWDAIDLILLEQLRARASEKHPEWTEGQVSELVETAWGLHLEHRKEQEGR